MCLVPEDCDVETIETIGALLENATARTILQKTSQNPMTARTLSDHCEASQPTVYRKLDELRECGLLVERTQPDPQEGHHRTVYATNLRRIVVHVKEGTIDVQIDRQEDIADRLTRFIEGG